MQKFSYHTHTTFSDGANSIEEMINRAAEIGYETLGISDHLTISINGFDEILSKAQAHVAAIKKAAAKAPIKVLAGFEVDYNSHPLWVEQYKEFTQKLGADYLFTGNHRTYSEDYMENYDIVFFPSYGFSEAESKIYYRRHFENILNAIESRLFAFIGHLDFIRWNNVVGEFDFRDERMAIIEALERTHTPFELNTKGKNSIGDFYPARWMLEELKRRDVPVLISDDAHSTTKLGQNYQEAEALLKELNYTNRWKLE